MNLKDEGNIRGFSSLEFVKLNNFVCFQCNTSYLCCYPFSESFDMMNLNCSSCISAKNNSCSIVSLFEAMLCFGQRWDCAWHVRAWPQSTQPPDIYHLSSSTRFAQAKSSSVNGHLQEGATWTEVIKMRYSYYPQQILSRHLIPSSILSQLLFPPHHSHLHICCVRVVYETLCIPLSPTTATPPSPAH